MEATGSEWINFSVNFLNYSRSGVYVFYAAMGDDKIPIYVGQSEKIAARLGEHTRASFNARTDFKVGRTARLLEERGYEILVEIEWTPSLTERERKDRENKLIERHRGGRPLLNFVKCKTESEVEYLSVLEKYVRENF